MSARCGKPGFVGQSHPDFTPDESPSRLRSTGMAILLQNARIKI
jgi:hypothetical protein